MQKWWSHHSSAPFWRMASMRSSHAPSWFQLYLLKRRAAMRLGHIFTIISSLYPYGACSHSPFNSFASAQHISRLIFPRLSTWILGRNDEISLPVAKVSGCTDWRMLWCTSSSNYRWKRASCGDCDEWQLLLQATCAQNCYQMVHDIYTGAIASCPNHSY